MRKTHIELGALFQVFCLDPSLVAGDPQDNIAAVVPAMLRQELLKR